MTKYICHPNLEVCYDISCEISPCVIEVADGSPEPISCSYDDNECTFCKWEKVI